MLKKKLQSGKTTIGTWITQGCPAIAEIFSNAGFDWLVVDLEHSSISLEQAGELIRVIDLSGCSPLVRVTSNDQDQIKRVMDAGAHGIIVPMINSARQAEAAVSATRYAPIGCRGVGLARAQQYGPGFKGYLEWQKDGPIVVVQIEDKKAVDNLQDIFSVPGVDAYFIGPYDLSCSMGIAGEFDNPSFLEIMEVIRSMGRDKGLPGGIHIVEPDLSQLEHAIGQNHQFIAYSVDTRMLDTVARAGVDRMKRIVT